MEIYKFYLAITDEQKVPLTRGAKILSVHGQFDQVALWAICDPNNEVEERTVYIYGTGNPLPKNINQRVFLGTAITDGGHYIWHVFE